MTIIEVLESLSVLYQANMTHTVSTIAFGPEEQSNLVDLALELFRLLVEKTDRTVLDFGNHNFLVRGYLGYLCCRKWPR